MEPQYNFKKHVKKKHDVYLKQLCDGCISWHTAHWEYNVHWWLVSVHGQLSPFQFQSDRAVSFLSNQVIAAEWLKKHTSCLTFNKCCLVSFFSPLLLVFAHSALLSTSNFTAFLTVSWTFCSRCYRSSNVKLCFEGYSALLAFIVLPLFFFLISLLFPISHLEGSTLCD